MKPVRFLNERNLTFVRKSTKNIKNSIQHCGRVSISRCWTNFRICQFHPCCMNTWFWFKFHFLFKLTLSSWHQSGFYGFKIFSSENLKKKNFIYETMAIICWNRTEVCNTDSISGPRGNKKENIRSHISSGKPGVCCILK